MTNNLSRKPSPYLQQHADNPVKWYPWGEEAFNKARELDRPVFLSIGYSTCHWCHVMAHESFEDRAMADILNDTFICIKVDREERPDIDSVYMKVAILATGRGGWPLSIFMTPEKEPFFAGTYIPRESRYGMMGFADLAKRIDHLWKNERDQLKNTANEILNALTKETKRKGKMTGNIIEKALGSFKKGFDSDNGGFFNAPKFPSPHQIMFLLRQYHRTGDKNSLRMAELTMEKMTLGGLFDHVGGGFHRYSTDREWLVPHFEKMLYDQATLIMAYAEIYQITGRDLFRRTIERTIEYVFRDLRNPEGLFMSAEDADSEGEEGRFYVWSHDEITGTFGREKGEEVADLFGVTVKGNYREESTGVATGKNILHLHSDVSWDLIETPLSILMKERSKRIRPGKDGKVLTDWNAMMISALSRAGMALGRDDLIREARRSMDALEKVSMATENKWNHRYIEGDSSVPAMLDDIAYLTYAYLDLYEATFIPSYLEKGRDLIGQMIRDFRDPDGGGLFQTSSFSEDLITRAMDGYDGAIPSGNSMAALAMIRIARMTGIIEYEEAASSIFDSFAGEMERAPTGYAFMLSAYMHALGPSKEIVIVEGETGDDLEDMLSVVRKDYLPFSVILLKNSDNTTKLVELSPFTENNIPINGRTTAYICEGWKCDMPVTAIEQLRRSLSLMD